MFAPIVPFVCIDHVIFVDREEDLPNPTDCFNDMCHDLNSMSIFLRSEMTMLIGFDIEFMSRVLSLPAPWTAMTMTDRIKNCAKQISTIRSATATMLYDEQGYESCIVLEITRHTGTEWHSQVLTRLHTQLSCILAH